MSSWSKLQKELYKIVDSRLDFQIHCVVYRMKSQRGSTDLPRYFITLGKDIIFDYPKQFAEQEAEKLYPYPYTADVSDISDLIREYMDTPTDELLDKNFETDKWRLTEILKAADKRIGKRRLDELALNTDSEAAKRIIDLRKRS